MSTLKPCSGQIFCYYDNADYNNLCIMSTYLYVLRGSQALTCSQRRKSQTHNIYEYRVWNCWGNGRSWYKMTITIHYYYYLWSFLWYNFIIPVYYNIQLYRARHSRLFDCSGQVDQAAGQRNFIDRLPADKRLSSHQQMAKIASDNLYHAEGNMRIAATCPAEFREFREYRALL